MTSTTYSLLSVTDSQIDANLDDAVAEAKRYAEKHVAGQIYDILDLPTNRAGDLAEKSFWYQAKSRD